MLVNKLEELLEAATFPDPRMRLDAQETLRELRANGERRKDCARCTNLLDKLEESKGLIMELRIQLRREREESAALKAKLADHPEMP